MNYLCSTSYFLLIVGLLFSPFWSSANDTYYTYDDLNRLIKAEYPSGIVFEYSYDGAGNRLTRQVNQPTVISGTVVDQNNNPMAGVTVAASAPGCDADIDYRGVTDASGGYIITVPPGQPYKVGSCLRCDDNQTENYVDEYWDGGEGVLHCKDAASTTPTIAVPSENINFQLKIGARISGEVSGVNGENVCVTAYAAIDEETCNFDNWAGAALIDSTGQYTFTVPAGVYYLHFDPLCGENSNNLLAEYWTSNSAGSAYCAIADTFTLGSGDSTTKSITLDTEGGNVEGTVYHSNGQPLTGVPIHVNLHSADSPCGEYHFVAGSGDIDTNNGTYIITGVPAGNYYLNTWNNNTGFVDEFWDGTSSDPDCSKAQLITVSAGATESGKDFYLEEGAVTTGNISGTVYDDQGQPLINVPIHVNVSSADGTCQPMMHIAGTGDLYSADGTYIIEGIPPGEYYLNTWRNTTTFIEEYWDGTSSDPDCSKAQLITVTAGVTETGKDFYLQQGALIAGHISGLASGEIACITAYDVSSGNTCDHEFWAGWEESDGAGDYQMIVPPGEYTIHFDPSCGPNSNTLITEYWTQDSSGTNNCGAADVVMPEAGDELVANVTLDEPGARITGNISGLPGGGTVCVDIMVPWQGSTNACEGDRVFVTQTNTSGDYSAVVSPGTYYMRTSPCGDSDEQYIIHKTWTTDGQGSINCWEGDSFTVVAGSNTPVNMAVEIGGRIAGFVYEDHNNTPLTDEADDVRIDVFTGNPCDYNFVGGGSVSLGDGAYTTSNLPVGPVFLKVNWADVHPNAWWTASGITDDCSQADAIPVAADQTSGGHIFILPKDTDGDGISDDDEDIYGLNPDNPDSDGDGIGDGGEVWLWGDDHDGDIDGNGILNIHETDADGDGTSDLQELARGSDMKDGASKPADLVLYDDFSGSLDPQKWWTADQLVREVEGGYLQLKVDSPYASRIGLDSQPLAVRNIRASFTIDEINPGSGELFFELAGNYYKDASNLDTTTMTGLVTAHLRVGDRGRGLEAWYVLGTYIDENGGWEPLANGEGEVVPANVALLLPGIAYEAVILYDGIGGFEFQVNQAGGPPLGTATATGPAYGASLAHSRSLAVETFADGDLSVHVDQVDTSDSTTFTPYDTFTQWPLDGSLWQDPELAREVTNTGTARLLAHSYGTKESVYLQMFKNYNYIETKLKIDSAQSQPGSTRTKTRLGGMLYNDSRGPGSGQPYNGSEGDIYVELFIQQTAADGLYAGAYAERVNDADWNNWEELLNDSLDISLSHDTEYTLFIGFAGDLLIFGIYGEDGSIATTAMPIETPRYLPSQPEMHLMSRVYGGNGEGRLLTTFDDVKVSGFSVVTPGDINVDGAVDLKDLILSLGVQTNAAALPYGSFGDTNMDGRIGMPDSLYIINEAAQP